MESHLQRRLTAPSTHSHLAMRHYIPALDGVRGLAILVVMLCHFTWVVVEHAPPTEKVGRLATEIFKTGRYGVDLFFVLSGYLITGILFDAKKDKHYFRNFYARRTLRIFPLYYAVLFALFVIAPIFVDWSSDLEQRTVRNQWWLWTYLGNIPTAFVHADYFHTDRLWLGHFWSLAIEEQFYLVWPMVILLLSRTGAMKLCVAMIFGAPVLRLVLYTSLGYYPTGLWAALYFTICKLDTLALGALLALAARSPKGLGRFSAMAPLTLVLSGLLLAPLIFFKWGKDTLAGAVAEDAKLSVICLFCGSLIVMALRSQGRGLFGWFFTHASMRFLGKYSYGIYIFHELFAPLFNGRFAIDKLAPRLGGSWWAGYLAHLAIAAAISIGAALLSWNLLEKHMLKLKRFFEHESPAPSPQAEARAKELATTERPVAPDVVPGLPAAPALSPRQSTPMG